MAKKSKFTTPTPPTKPVVSSSTLPRKTPTKPWHTYLTIDLLAKVASYTILHPWPAWMLPLCLRAQVYAYDSPAMMISIAWAIFLTTMWLLGVIDRRIAYGLPREVSLAEETIVITGGASGLGLLIAEVYGMRGANVAVLDVKQLDGEKRGVRFYQCDVGDRAEVEAAIAKIRQDIGPPTILVNNAGIVNGKSLLQLSAAEVERNFRVNLLSHFHTIQTILPIMLEEDCGTIVTVSSVLGQLGAAKLGEYAWQSLRKSWLTFRSRLYCRKGGPHCYARFVARRACPVEARIRRPDQDSPLHAGPDVYYHVQRREDALELPWTGSRTRRCCKGDHQDDRCWRER